jgi:hypothetical protein
VTTTSVNSAPSIVPADFVGLSAESALAFVIAPLIGAVRAVVLYDAGFPLQGQGPVDGPTLKEGEARSPPAVGSGPTASGTPYLAGGLAGHARRRHDHPR